MIELTLNDKKKTTTHHCFFHTPVEGKGDKKSNRFYKNKREKRKEKKPPNMNILDFIEGENLWTIIKSDIFLD